MRIWKYTLKIDHGVQRVTMPNRPRVVKIGNQYGKLCMWAEVNEEADQFDYGYQVVGTGWELPKFGIYLGSAIIEEFVWHVYQV